jgi:hypothetical protein
VIFAFFDGNDATEVARREAVGLLSIYRSPLALAVRANEAQTNIAKFEAPECCHCMRPSAEVAAPSIDDAGAVGKQI